MDAMELENARRQFSRETANNIIKPLLKLHRERHGFSDAIIDGALYRIRQGTYSDITIRTGDALVVESYYPVIEKLADGQRVDDQRMVVFAFLPEGSTLVHSYCVVKIGTVAKLMCNKSIARYKDHNSQPGGFRYLSFDKVRECDPSCFVWYQHEDWKTLTAMVVALNAQVTALMSARAGKSV